MVKNHSIHFQYKNYVILFIFALFVSAFFFINSVVADENNEGKVSSTDFSEYDSGSIPEGWSQPWVESSWEIQSTPNLLVNDSSSANRRVLTYDEIGEIEGDVEVFALVRGTGNETLFQLPIYVSGIEGQETSYYLDASARFNRVRINQYDNGNYSTISAETKEISSNVFYKVLFQREGTKLRAKIWEDGTPEPVNWDIETEHTNLTNGKVGIGGTSSNTKTDWAYFSVGTLGQSAPRIPEVFSTDFSEYESGSIPEGWSQPWAESSWEIQEDSSLLINNSLTSNRRVLTYDEIGEVTGDVEIFALVRGTGNETLFQLPIYVSGVAGEENSYYLDVSALHNNIRINHYNNGSYSTISSKSREITSGVFYRVLFQREGTMLRAKIWENGTPEPEGWDLEANHTGLTHGRVGLGGTSGNMKTDWAYFSVGTGGQHTSRAPEGNPDPQPELDFEVLEPQNDSLIDLNPGDPLQINMDISRRYSNYILEFKSEDNDDWVEFAAGLSQGYIQENGNVTLTMTIPIDTVPGHADLRIRLEADGESKEEIINNAFNVGIAPEILTGFELRDGVSWTTHSEEVDFLNRILSLGENMNLEEIGRTVNGLPIHLVRIGVNANAPLNELENEPTIFLNCGQHGNEPSSREACLQTMRELVLTNDPDVIEYLSQNTVLINPTANPDGRVNNTRGNADGIDTNRDHLELFTPEGQAIASVLKEVNPDVILDMHDLGGPNPQRSELEVAWSTNHNVSSLIIDTAGDLVLNHILSSAKARGYSADPYGGLNPGGSLGADRNEQIIRNIGGLRHSITLLSEVRIVSRLDRPEEYVNSAASQLRRNVLSKNVIKDLLSWHQDNFLEINLLMKEVADDAKTKYFEGNEPFYFTSSRVIEEVPCGYILTKEQFDQIHTQLDLHGITFSNLNDDKILILMNQSASTVIPFLIDERANHHLISAKPVYECEAYLVDKSELESAVASIEAENLDETDYTEESWLAFVSALQQAKNVLDNDEATQDEVNEALEDLNNARAGLVESEDPVDKSALAEAIASIEAENLDEENYTEESWAVFASAIQHAKNVLDSEEASQDEVDKALEDLNNARAGLVEREEPVDKSALVEAIAFIEAENLDEEDYTEESWTAFASAIQQAKNVLDNDEATQDEVDEALEDLNNARAGLVENEDPVDKSALAEAIASIEAENLDEENYTEESWAVFASEIQQAKNVLDSEKATQDEVDKALEDLNNARAGLIESEEPVDKSALAEAIAFIEAENLDKEDYTEESWTAFASAMQQAKNVLDSEEASQDEVDEALEDLNNARAGLVESEEPVDKSALAAAIASIEAKNLDEEDYTEESWTTFENALQHAKDILSNEEASQDDVDQALEDLNNARSGLVESEEPIDKKALADAISSIEKENLDEEDYTEESWTTFENALQHAKDILSNEEASQDEVDQALAKLNSARVRLIENEEPIDKTALADAISSIEKENLDEEDYTEESWTTFASALQHAKNILSNEEASQDDVDQALEDLNNTRTDLIESEEPIDKTALADAIATIDAENLDEQDYTKESWKAFANALQKAKNILNNTQATQEQVTQALADLNNTRTDLVESKEPVKPVDKTALASAITSIESEELDEADYTKSSWKDFVNALQEARTVLADEEVTQNEINRVLETLIKAHEDLIEVKEEPKEKPEDDSNGDPEEESQEEETKDNSKETIEPKDNDGDQLPSTATPLYNLLFAGILFIIIASIIIYTRHRKTKVNSAS